MRINICISDYFNNHNLPTCIKFYPRKQIYKVDGFYNISLSEGNDYIYSFKNCYSRKHECNYLKNGKIYMCAIIANIDRFNKYFNKNYGISEVSDGIDIYNHSAKEILDFLKTPNYNCSMCDVDNTSKKEKWCISKKRY